MDITTKLFSLLKICISSRTLQHGRQVHQKMLTLGLQNNISLCKNLINFYVHCQCYDSANLVFKSIENPFDISLWNGLMALYTKNLIYIEALELFERLFQCPFLDPDCFTYPSVLKACGGLGRVSYGRMVHALLIKFGFVNDIVVASSLVGMYAKCNLFGCAIELFDEIPERDVITWNTIISCSYQNGRADKALELFEKMRESGFEPNSVALTTALASCARLSDLGRGKEIHKELVKNGFELDGFVSSALVDMYGKCGCLEMAKEVFEKMPTKSVVAWNSIIAVYSSISDSRECIAHFRRMNVEGAKPTPTTLSSILVACARSAQLQHGKFIHAYTLRNKIDVDSFFNGTLIDLYFKCGRINLAENIFQSIPKADVVCWNVMISGYVTVGCYPKALDIYDEMKVAGLKPNAATYTSILSACSQLAALEKGKEIHKVMIEQRLGDNEVVMGALLDMYGKCGAIDEALSVFSKLPERDLVSWTSMINAYGYHGQALEALKLFGEMQRLNIEPDEVTFLAVLSACSHVGLVDEGYSYFTEMITRYGIEPKLEHYSCLIDLLGRVGRLSEAYKIIQGTQEFRQDVNLLSTLLSACRLHKDLELGEKIAKSLIKKDRFNLSTYITLSNMYASAKKWDDVGRVRTKMKKLGVKKNHGCSWIEIDKKIQSFFSEDRSHPKAGMVSKCLKMLTSHMEMDDMLPSQQSKRWFLEEVIVFN